MRTLFGISMVLGLAFGGCGGGTHYEDSTSDDDWSSSSTSGTSTDAVDAGVDGGVDAGVDAGDPVRNRAMALFARSCTPCHRHESSIDYEAVARGVYLETDAEILARVTQYTIGNTPTSLPSIIAQRAEGYELMVGSDGRSPMPPRGSAYTPWTQDEARAVLAWLNASR